MLTRQISKSGTRALKSDNTPGSVKVLRKAFAVHSDALRQDPRNAYMLTSLARVYIAGATRTDFGGNPGLSLQKAMELLSLSSKLDDSLGVTHFVAAEAFLILGNFSEAMRAAVAATERNCTLGRAFLQPHADYYYKQVADPKVGRYSRTYGSSQYIDDLARLYAPCDGMDVNRYFGPNRWSGAVRGL